jgi:hypothetical protein
MGTLHQFPLKKNNHIIDQCTINLKTVRDIQQIKNSVATARSLLIMLKLKDEQNPHQEYYDLIIDEMNRASSTIAEMLSSPTQYAD